MRGVFLLHFHDFNTINFYLYSTHTKVKGSFNNFFFIHNFVNELTTGKSNHNNFSLNLWIFERKYEYILYGHFQEHSLQKFNPLTWLLLYWRRFIFVNHDYRQSCVYVQKFKSKTATDWCESYEHFLLYFLFFVVRHNWTTYAKKTCHKVEEKKNNICKWF